MTFVTNSFKINHLSNQNILLACTNKKPSFMKIDEKLIPIKKNDSES